MTIQTTLRIQRGNTIPDFTLPDPSGNEVSTRSYYMHRNLVIAFLPSSPSAEWDNWLRGLAHATAEIPRGDVEVFVIVPPGSTPELPGALDEATDDFRVLIDTDDAVRRRFGAPEDEGLLLFTDRWGQIFFLATGTPEDEEFDPESVPGRVEFIVCQC